MTTDHRPTTNHLRADRYSLLVTRCSLLIALLLAACGSGPRPGYVIEQQRADGITIGLERPQEAEILKDYQLIVTLADAQGQPIDGATVFADLVMPSMPMGSNQPLADPLGGGRYSIKGLFTMEGGWHITIHARVAGQEHSAAFEQPVRPAQ